MVIDRRLKNPCNHNYYSKKLFSDLNTNLSACYCHKKNMFPTAVSLCACRHSDEDNNLDIVNITLERGNYSCP